VSTPHDDAGEDQHDRWRVEQIARFARSRGRTVAVAESLTSGRISACLGAGSDAADWYRGAVVAYDESVKFGVLGVTRGPVVTDSCAREMAEGVRRLLGADISLGISGVGGPGSQEGRPPGTVHLAVASSSGTRSQEVHLPGSPEEVLGVATGLALDELLRELSEPRRSPGTREGDPVDGDNEAEDPSPTRREHRLQ
jgi:nicotinamide-nucleotide amidase